MIVFHYLIIYYPGSCSQWSTACGRTVLTCLDAAVTTSIREFSFKWISSKLGRSQCPKCLKCNYCPLLKRPLLLLLRVGPCDAETWSERRAPYQLTPERRIFGPNTIARFLAFILFCSQCFWTSCKKRLKGKKTVGLRLHWKKRHGE